MRKNSRLQSTRAFSISPGWLFADLLLALAVLFLAANTLSVKPPPTAAKGHPMMTPTPTPTPTPRPTSVSGHVLESTYCRIVLNDKNLIHLALILVLLN